MDNSELFKIFQKKYNVEIGKFLGRGGFGEVREIISSKGKIYAGKLVKKKIRRGNDKANQRGKGNGSGNGSESEEEENIILFLKSPNIVKIHKIYEEKINKNGQEEIYELVVMEKAVLKDLKTFIKSIYNQNICNLIYDPFKEVIGDSLLKFLTRQIIKGLELFERNEFIHFDIKPENILIFLELYLKITDFGLLRDVSQLNKIRIPGGTPGYLSPEYYQNYRFRVPINIAKKQDYFALGATIFLLKYGKQMIKIKINKTNKSEENKLSQQFIIDLIQKNITYIKSDKIADKDFVNFLCSLIQIFPDDRPCFEEIYRNKWINRNISYIQKVFIGFRDDEQKLIVELRKNDYLMEKKNEFEINNTPRKKFYFRKKNKNKIVKLK